MITLKRLTVPSLKHLREIDLWLPRRGATLIEGANESGKSTLFEAIYFALYGRPLVGEEPGKAILSSLIPHDGAQAQVTLTLLAGETQLEVTRTLTRTRSGGPTSEASLVVSQPDRADERINAVSAVNDRILAELRGLDGDTLRNSCFMEQKGLERLESLRRDEREEAISRLLGLERLISAERALAPSAEERRRVERLRDRARMVAQRRSLREATERHDDVSQRLDAAELREWIEERDTLVARMDYLAERELSLANDLREQEALLTRVDALRAAERRLAETERQRWRARQAAQETSLLTSQLHALEEIEGGSAPDAQRRLDNIRRLEAELREIASERGRLEQAYDLVKRVRAAEETQRAARDALTQAERSQKETVTALARSQARDTLAEWILARERADVREGKTQQLVALRTMLGQHERQAAETQAQSWQWLALAGASLLMALISAALAIRFSIGPLWIFVVLASIGVVGLGMRWRLEISTSRAHRWKMTEAEQGISSVHAEVNLAQRLMNDDLGRLEARLRAAGMSIPRSVEDGEQLLSTLPNTSDFVSVEGRARDAESKAARARVELERALGDAESASESLANLGFDSDSDELEHRLADVREREAAITAEARELGLPDDVTGLAAARGAAEVTFSTLNSRAGNRDELHTRLLASSESLEDLLSAWGAELEGVARDLANLGVLEAPALPDPLETHALETLHEGLGEQTQRALAPYDEAAARSRLASLIAERERLSVQTDETCESHGRLRDQIQERLTSLGMTAQGDESLTTLTQLWPLLGEVTAAEAPQLRAEREQARLRAYHEEQNAAEQSRQTPLASGPLEESDAQAELEAAERDLKRRELACDLASEVRARVIRRALPETEAYMRAILPALTAGRYHDVTLLREDASGSGAETDIAIRMWDQAAGRYVRKNLFSGGARDQASLALRLAFALATLPKELGATPGFIFLDEPLSAFDAERSLALARVLTTGAIAEAFAQIFLISHSQDIDPRLFDYMLRMEDGRVAESTLPSGALAESLWEAEVGVGVEARLGA
ncbi:MAG TPA: AAA family ATPase [Ktedonobacterales bacterium]|nr:AAA family ATPase [Ktedonobacterales bacterium]